MILDMGAVTEPAAKLATIPSGPAGTRATLRLMKRLVREALRDPVQIPVIRRTALSLIRNLSQKDRAGELLALFEFVRDRIRYVRDIRDIETLQTPLETLQQGQGDCDDKSMLLATLIEALGYKTRFIAVGQQPGKFQHVYVEVRLRDGWLPLETTEPVLAGWAPGAICSRMVEHI